MRSLFRDVNYTELVYMTGILPIKKYGTQSVLNMFTERTMINMANLAPFTGFTEEDVKELCNRYDIDFYDMKHWYDGYIVNGIHVYNPRSVVAAIGDRMFGSHWTSTESYESLRHYISLNFDGLKETIVAMLAGDRCKIRTSRFQNDMMYFETKDDVLTLLIHLGYLSYKLAKDNSSITGTIGEVFIPN